MPSCTSPVEDPLHGAGIEIRTEEPGQLGVRERNRLVVAQEVAELVEDDVILVQGTRLFLVKHHVEGRSGYPQSEWTRIRPRGVEEDGATTVGGHALAEGLHVERDGEVKLAQSHLAPLA